jgi:hypothetical protein
MAVTTRTTNRKSCPHGVMFVLRDLANKQPLIPEAALIK